MKIISQNTLRIFFIALLIISFQKTNAQLPNCAGSDSNKIFIQAGADIYRFDPTLPVTATNPSLFAATGTVGGGLTISYNLNGGVASPTFYTAISGNYNYWNGAAWVNTGHTAGTVNHGGGVNFIYGYVGGSNDIFKYNGLANAVNIGTIIGAGPYDLVTDATDNFYFFDANNMGAGRVRKYSPTAVLLDSILVAGNPSSGAGGGFSIVGNTMMASFTGGDIWLGTISAGAVTIANMGTAPFTISDVAQCPATVAPQNPQAIIAAPDTTCGALCVTPTDASIGNIATWQWSFPGATPANSVLQNPGQICYTTSGAKNISLIVIDSLGNADTTTKTILVSAAKTIVSTPDKITCVPGDTTKLTATGAFQYSWTPNVALSCNNCSSPMATPFTSTQYIATGTDNIGCKTKDTVKITILPMQASILIADDSICITEKLNATSTASGSGINWQWNLGDGTTVNNNVTISNYQYANANSYLLQLIVWDTLGCRDTTTEIIFVDALGYANFTIDDSLLCIGEPLIIRDSISAKAVSFQYNYTPDLFVLNNVHNPIHSFDIITTSLLPVILTVDFEQCPDIVVAKNIKISPFPAVDLGADTNICPGVTAAITLSNKANASGAKLWSTGETVPMINVTEPNTYWLTVTDNDCSASDTANINRDCYINIPNSFTPNNDGLNDYFMPMDLLSSGATAYTMNIFNRWGEIVFSTASLTSNGWDGKFGGKPQPIGTYVYQIDVVFKNTSRKNFHGNVTLLR